MTICRECGHRMRVAQKRYTKTETYRQYKCSLCGCWTISVEYELEMTEANVTAFRAATVTKPKGGDEE